MSSNRLFNKNYAMQNVKKSKGILAIMILIIPVISLFIMYSQRPANYYVAPLDFASLAIPNILGMFIIPFVLSNVLLGYVYKQNSIDFINAMPISRRNIYITNIVLGSIYIIILQLFNLLVQGIFILISSTYIVFPMIWSIFITMTVRIFVHFFNFMFGTYNIRK